MIVQHLYSILYIDIYRDSIIKMDIINKSYSDIIVPPIQKKIVK